MELAPLQLDCGEDVVGCSGLALKFSELAVADSLKPRGLISASQRTIDVTLVSQEVERQ